MVWYDLTKVGLWFVMISLWWPCVITRILVWNTVVVFLINTFFVYLMKVILTSHLKSFWIWNLFSSISITKYWIYLCLTFLLNIMSMGKCSVCVGGYFLKREILLFLLPLGFVVGGVIWQLQHMELFLDVFLWIKLLLNVIQMLYD